MNERIIELETRVTFQEESIQSLSQAFGHQQQIINELRLEIDELRQRLKAVTTSIIDEETIDLPPPHY